jgi:SAM-dependent methyltransferase
MYHVGAPSVENFLVVGDAWGQVVSKHLVEPGQVLDIGCGCGRTARMLLHHPFIEGYVGFDVIKPYVDWDTAFLTPISDGRFRFVHLDVRSDYYNPTGSISPDSVTFPSQDGVFSLAFAASLFTHLKEGAARRYLSESRRVLRQGGRLIASVHTDAVAGTNWSGDESRADVRPEYWLALAADAGFSVEKELGEICGQATYTFRAII